jgi:hypothetical protein
MDVSRSWRKLRGVEGLNHLEFSRFPNVVLHERTRSSQSAAAP